jgi:2'-5' RNA ligase
MNDCPIYVFALEPDAAYRQWVGDCKRRVRQLVGEQLYLDHPPHLTLYVAAFPAKAEVSRVVGELAGRLQSPQAVLNHWHVFQADQLTGNHTLVCDVPEESCQAFREVQSQVVAALAPLCDVSACRCRYDGAWQRLSAVERANVEQYGFPFVGQIWRAHVTIASIRTADWPALEPVLRESPPSVPVCFDALAVYRLQNDFPLRVEQHSLRA